MTTEIIVALVGGVVSITLGVIVFRGARKTDAISERSGIAADTRAGIEQSFKILDGIIENLREDKDSVRTEVTRLSEALKQLTVDFDICKKELAELKRLVGS